PVLHAVLIQERCHAHLCPFLTAHLQHPFGRTPPLDGKPIPQKRHQEAARPTGNFQGDPAIATKALVEKGLIPEWFLTEPQIITLGRESTVGPIRLSHDAIHVEFDAAFWRTRGACPPERSSSADAKPRSG